MKKEKINIPLLLIFFYFLFPFTFKGIKVIQYALIYGISFLGILLNFNKVKKYLYNNYCIYAMFFYIIVLFASIIIPVAYKTYDFSYFSYLLNILKYSMKMIFLACLIINKHKEKADIYMFFKYYVLSCIILLFTTIFFIMFPAAKNIWSNIIDTTGNQSNLILQENYITRFSIIGFTGFRQTFIFTMATIFELFILQTKEETKKNVLLLIMCIAGTFLYGRTGFIVSIFSLLFTLPALKLNKKNLKIIILIIICFVIVFTILYNLKDKNALVYKWYRWAFSVFISLNNQESITNNRSLSAVLNMWFLPEPLTMLIGDGFYTLDTGEYYMHVDIGYLRPVLFYGAFFTVLGYSIFIFVNLGIKRIFIKNANKFGKFMMTLILIDIAIFELKGEIFYFAIALIIPLFLILGNTETYKEIESNQKEIVHYDR